MIVLKDIPTARQAVVAERGEGREVGLVPTMGALHRGHRSLIDAARAQCSFVVVTIFVNPTQFEPGADFEAYPRTLEGDLTACERAGVDMVFTPSVEAMYPAGSSTSVHVAGVTEGLCGRHRAGHFDGVATVVAKLFHILPADRAYFGEKDYQQLVTIQRMVQDLKLPMAIVACPTVREDDGLACSSRNAYLSEPQRRQAASLSRALFAAAAQVAQGMRNAAEIAAGVRRDILGAGPAKIEYVEVVDAETLEPLAHIDRSARICLAVRLGSCRLIDNVGVGG